MRGAALWRAIAQHLKHHLEMCLTWHLPCSIPITSMLPPDLACIAIFRSARAETLTLQSTASICLQACTV